TLCPTATLGVSGHVLHATVSGSDGLSLDIYRQSSGTATTQQLVGLYLCFPVPTTMILRATPDDRSCREYARVTTQTSAFNQRWRVLAEKSADVGRIEHLLSSRFADLM